MFVQNNFAQATPVCAPHHDAEVRALLAAATPGPVTFHKANAIIYDQGDKAGPLYLVEFGTVRICRITADGRRQINSFHFAGDVFGFEADADHQSYAESVDGAGIRQFRPAVTASSAPGLLSLALKSFARMQQHLLLLGRMNATEKLATFLLDLLDRQQSDTTIALQMQRNDIADYLGMTFETVSRVLGTLRDRHVIRLLSVDRIAVDDVPALMLLGGQSAD